MSKQALHKICEWGLRPCELRVAGAPQNGTRLSEKKTTDDTFAIFPGVKIKPNHITPYPSGWQFLCNEWELGNTGIFIVRVLKIPKTQINRRLQKSTGVLLELLPGQGRVLPSGADAPAAGPTAEHYAGNQAKPLNWKTKNMHQKITENQNTSTQFDHCKKIISRSTICGHWYTGKTAQTNH